MRSNGLRSRGFQVRFLAGANSSFPSENLTAGPQDRAGACQPQAVTRWAKVPWGGLCAILCASLWASPAFGQVTEPPKAGTPWWATSLAVAGPLADGMSTVYAMSQSGPYAQIAEGNGFYHKLFGADVKPAEIMAFKVGQAALFGAVVHYAGKQNRKAAIGVAIATAAINFTVSAMNCRNGQHVKRLNAGAR